MKKRLSEAARRFLLETRFAVIATINRDGTPQQSNIWYQLDGDDILMNTKRDRLKDRNLRRDPRLSVCVEDGNRYLTLRGRSTLIDDQTVAQEDIRRLASRYHGEQTAKDMMSTQFSKEQRITIRMTIESSHEYKLD
jgi:PPOX class probable F420-dependent enzyme